MSLRLQTASDYENYFERLSQANWETHYLTSNGEVARRCPCGRWFIRLFSCFRNYFQPDIGQAKSLIEARIDAYDAAIQMVNRKDGFQTAIIHTAEKINELIEKIKKKRPSFELEGMKDTAYQAKWLGMKGGSSGEKKVKSHVGSGTPISAYLDSMDLHRAAEQK